MTSTYSRDISPDAQHLFPNSVTVSTTILSQTFSETCPFIVHRPELIACLEVVTANVYRLCTVLALQQITSVAIPHLVPKAESAGVAQTEDGTAVEFFNAHCVTLESVWDSESDNLTDSDE